MNKFGVTVEMNNITLILLKRVKNFSLQAGVDDLKVSVFQTQFSSEQKIYVPIL